MAVKIIERIHNTKTGDIKDIERELDAQELAQWELDKVKAEAESQAKAKAVAAKAALLEKLGITEEEAKLLLS